MLVFSKSFENYITKCDNAISEVINGYIQLSLTEEQRTENFDESKINYITFRSNGNISYLPAGKQHINEIGPSGDLIWKRENRQEGKAAKIIRKIFTKEGLEQFKDTDFESFTNCYKAEFSSNGLKFSLLPNSEIPSVYSEEMLEGDGTLNGSCMQASEDNSIRKAYFSIYENCSNLQILVLKQNGLLAGRALIWKLTDNITFMDRIYYVKEHYREMFIDYAINNKWWRKEKQSYANKTSFYNENQELIPHKIFKIQLDTDFDYYPYIDTFTYGEDGMITNDCGYDNYVYAETSGERTDNNNTLVYDEIDDVDINEDDAILITRGRYRDRYTHESNSVEISDQYWWKDDDGIVYIRGEYYTKDSNYTCYNDLTEEWDLIDNCAYIDCGIHEGQNISADECVRDINHNYWWKDDDDIEEIDGDYYEIGTDEYNDKKLELEKI